ncbi:MAG: type 2 lantipeptide synthetase LanM family protein [Bacteroidetes bacterium]|nr:type 2 lantipeptide synthetase LanM family protein [Bacteroidota bacterium]
MNALFIHERTRHLETIRQSGHQPAQASRLLERWQQQSPFRRKPEWFAIKLQEEGLSAEDFLQMVAQPDLDFLRKHAGKAFAWKNDVLRIRLQGNGSAPDHNFYRPQFPELGFLNLFIPLLHEATARLKSRIEPLVEAHPELFGNMRRTAGLLQASLWERLLKMVTKTMVLELNVFKLRKKLHGTTSEERFADFVAQLNTPRIRDYFYRDYPVLIRQAAHVTDQWIEQSSLFCERLVADFPHISASWLGQPGLLTEVRFGEGDAHRGGRTVAIVRFENGQKVVYKPRPLHIDVHFRELLQWLNEKTGLDLRSMQIFTTDTHGWVEFIEHLTCTSENEVQHFYQQTGAYIALLYTLEATDFHYENIVANGKYPVLIDLESFFHPYFPTLGTETNQAGEASVMRTGLLPMRISLKEEDQGLDISGLSDTEGQTTLFKVGTLEGIGTDEVKITRQAGRMEGGANIPMLNGQRIKMRPEHISAIQEGFSLAYQALMLHGHELSDPQTGLLNRFGNDDVRVLFRDTFVYSHLLDESWHPQIQRNALELERHFDWLWAVAPDYQLIRKLIKFEKQDLRNGDVPLFSTRVNSRHLWYADHACVENFFSQTGLELVRQRLSLLSTQDMQRQLWLIEASLTASLQIPRAQEDQTAAAAGKQALATDLAPASNEMLLAEAIRVGDYLYEQAFKGANDAQWMALKTEDDNTLRLMPMYYDLFSGAMGEILFLAYLHRVTGAEKYRTLAENALTGLLKRIEYGQESIRPLGLFAGWGSVVFVLTHLAKLWNRQDLVQHVERLYDTLPLEALLEADKSYSLVKGSAGFVAACLAFYHTFGNKKALQRAKEVADYLLLQADKEESGIGWRIASKVPLAGMSHGASGFALVYQRLFETSGERRYKDAVTEILRYERSLYNETRRNWRDCRDAVQMLYPDQHVFSTGWAHGAPGIGLARLELLKGNVADQAVLEQELTTALATTLRGRFNQSHNLTMGSFGSLELLFTYGLQENDAAFLDKSKKIAAALLQQIQETGWNCGLPNQLLTPGFMTGVTGIGYQCLRMAAPDQVPSILLTQSPFQTT